jgi:hypothetical protein
MGMKTIIFHGVMGVTLLALSIVILVSVDSKLKSYQFDRHQNLHPLQAPFDVAYNFQLKNITSLTILISDLSTISFNTIGFPSKLASAMQVGKMLNASKPLTSLVYPIIDNTTKSRILFDLAAHYMHMNGDIMAFMQMLASSLPTISSVSNMSNTTVGVKQPEPVPMIQNIFKIHDTLTLNQTDYYCPLRGPTSFEQYADWVKRTEQSQSSFEDSYKSHMQFTYNNIHEQKCHGQRTESMVMTHVAIDMYNLFSTHSTGTLLLGVTSIAFAFLWFETINLLYANIGADMDTTVDETYRPNSLKKEEHRVKQMKLHTLTTLLKLICVVLVVVFLSVNYVYNTSYADWTKNRIIPTSSFLMVSCSSVLAFLILYMHGSFKMIGHDARMKMEIKTYCERIEENKLKDYLDSMGVTLLNNKENTLNRQQYIEAMISRGLFPSLDLIREKIESEKEVLLYSYSWFVTIPLFFMAWYTDKVYGVDLHMQLILLAFQVGCILDILYIRMALLIDVVWDIYIKNHRDDQFDSKVYTLGSVADITDPFFQNTVVEVKFVLWVLFLVVRLTIIIIPEMLFEEECDKNCGWLTAFVVAFEVIPILVPLVDQYRTYMNKEYDVDDFKPHNTSVDKAGENKFTGGEPMKDRKNENLRVLVYCVVYYFVLTVACVIFCVVHLGQGIPENDKRMYELVMS